MTTSEDPQEWQIAECLLPGLTLQAAEDIAVRITAALAGHPRPDVTYVGSLLMPGDEVLLCLFSGQESDVRSVSEAADLPFERILAGIGLGRLSGAGWT